MQKDNKICFVICANNKQYEKECLFYIDRLEIPDHYEIEKKIIWGASSMTAGYNQAVRESDAKYKVYLHQDVFIFHTTMLQDCLDIFQKNPQIGMLGVLGGDKLPNNGIIYSAWNIGRTKACDSQDAGVKVCQEPEKEYQEVKALDGMFLMTQYDLPWQEQWFDRWDFYDISQSFEFQKNQYKVAVVRQENEWCLHDCGRTKLADYDDGRKMLLEKYGDFFVHAEYRPEDFKYHFDVKRQFDQWKKSLEDSFHHRDYSKIKEITKQYDDTTIQDTELSLWKKMLEIVDQEQQYYGSDFFLHYCMEFEEVKERYNQVKFLLWRWENEIEDVEAEKQFIIENEISAIAFVKIAMHNAYQMVEDLEKIWTLYHSLEKEKDQSYIEWVQGQLNGGTQKSHNPRTEEDIKQVEQICRQQAETRSQLVEPYQKKIDILLSENTDEARKQLFLFLSSFEFDEVMKYVTEFAYLQVSAGIYQSECEEGIKDTIWHVCHNMKEVIDYIIELKFLLWHLEFDTEKNAEETLYAYMDGRGMSVCMLRYMVKTAGLNKVDLLVKLSILYMDHQKLGGAFSLLKYADELCPGQEDILCTMADLCLQVGKKQEALLLLDRVEEPGNTTEVYRKMCANE